MIISVGGKLSRYISEIFCTITVVYVESFYVKDLDDPGGFTAYLGERNV